MKGNGWFKAFIGVLGGLILTVLAFAYSQGMRDAGRDAKLKDHERRISKNEKMEAKVDSILFMMAVQYEVAIQKDSTSIKKAAEVIRNHNAPSDTLATNEYRTDNLEGDSL